jgi:hypothetical protein
MKIGIITLPFNANYGGLLQAYALQSVLRQMGHEVLTINRLTKGMPLKMKVLSFTRRLILRVVFQRKVVVRTWPNAKEENITNQHTNRFIRENIRTTELIDSDQSFSRLEQYAFDAYVVGSDQVWRPKYSPSITNHFLGFLKDNQKIKRIAYAPSFGVENWEFTPKQTEDCSALAKKFHAISVREDSAVELCNKHLGVEAIQVLDPTLLVSREEYVSLVEKDKIPRLKGTLLTYVLDLTPEKKGIIQSVMDELNLKPVSVMPKSLFREAGSKKLDQCIFPPVTEWIRGFMDAEFVVTDSFHGTVFSIIFNKPFLAVGNSKRGMNRFTSLLRLFDMEDRLILSAADMQNIKLNAPVDFDKVNQILNHKREQAFSFLKNSLKK